MLALGALKAIDHLSVLHKALGDPEPSVRIAAVQGLTGVNGPETPERLLAALRNDDQVQMRQACIGAFIAMGERGRPCSQV
jgi:HEAT repeat protein